MPRQWSQVQAQKIWAIGIWLSYGCYNKWTQNKSNKKIQTWEVPSKIEPTPHTPAEANITPTVFWHETSSLPTAIRITSEGPQAFVSLPGLHILGKSISPVILQLWAWARSARSGRRTPLPLANLLKEWNFCLPPVWNYKIPKSIYVLWSQNGS